MVSEEVACRCSCGRCTLGFVYLLICQEDESVNAFVNKIFNFLSGVCKQKCRG